MSLSSLSALKIKVSAGSSIRRTTVKAPVSFESVVVVLERLFDLAPGQKFVVKYLDDENELITISTEEDLREAVQVMNDSGAPSLKLSVVFPDLEVAAVDGLLVKKSKKSTKEVVEEEEEETAEGAATTVIGTGGAKKKALAFADEDDPKFVAKKEKLLKKMEDVESSSKKEEVKLAKKEKLLKKLEKLESRVEKVSSTATSGIELEDCKSIEVAVPPYVEAKDASASPRAAAVDGPVVHFGFGCNACGAKPIVGKRFRCTSCFDYDLCEACETSGVHPAEHTLVMHKTATASLTYGHFAPFAAAALAAAGSGGDPAAAMQFFRWEGKADKPWKRYGRGHHHRHHHDDEDESDVKAGVEAGAESAEKPKREFRGGRRGRRFGDGSGYCAKFIRDATLEKGAVVERDSLLVKTWAVQNDGEIAWPESVKLRCISGDTCLLFEGQTEFAVPAARANQVVDVSAVLKAPSARGRYKTGFRLVDAEGKQFGHSLWIDIIVV